MIKDYQKFCIDYIEYNKDDDCTLKALQVLVLLEISEQLRHTEYKLDKVIDSLDTIEANSEFIN